MPVNPIIKWPGGKSREIDQIYHLLPKFHRYVEPFFGGGALFFHLAPPEAAVNDISEDLMAFYKLVQSQDLELHRCLNRLDKTFQGLIDALTAEAETLYELFEDLNAGFLTQEQLEPSIAMLLSRLGKTGFDKNLIIDPEEFYSCLQKNAADKFIRTLKNHKARPFSREDVPRQILTEDGGHIRLPQSFPDLFERANGPEPLIPYREYKEDDSFCAAAPYDFISLAISPRYAPEAADALIPIFESYMR